MPRQIDQLPADVTSLARRVRELQQELRELRAARRMSSATVKTLRVYAEDGTTLAVLGPDGLWTRGATAAAIGGGELRFQPVDDRLVAAPGRVSYDTDAMQYSKLILTSGAAGASDHQALLTLESASASGIPRASVQGEEGTPANLDVRGVFTAASIATGSVAITPSAANVPTSATVTGLSVKGVLRAFTGIANPAPGYLATGVGVTGTGYTNLTSTGLTVWATRQDTTPVTVTWLVIGLDA